MKQNLEDSKNGSALLISLFFMVMTSSIAGVYLAYSSFDQNLTRRTIDQEKVRIAAESALDYGLIALRDKVFFNQLTLSRSSMQSTLDGIAAPTAAGTYQYSGPGGESGFRITVENETVSGVITQGFYTYHTAIDIGVPLGTAVHAADSGYVVVAGWSTVGYGNYIIIDHRNGYRTLYAHLSKFNVQPGQAVNQGDIIGYSGSTGNSTGPHLHLEIELNGVKQNPFNYLP